MATWELTITMVVDADDTTTPSEVAQAIESHLPSGSHEWIGCVFVTAKAAKVTHVARLGAWNERYSQYGKEYVWTR